MTRAAEGLDVYAHPGAWFAPHDVMTHALLDPATALLATIGLLLCAVHVRKPGPLLVVLWIGGTFVAAQVLTDIPISAYRAAPLLPAVAIAAAIVLSRVAEALSRAIHAGEGSRLCHRAVAVVLLWWASFAVPWNGEALDRFFRLRASETVTGFSRLAHRMPKDADIALLSTEGISTDPRFRLIAGGDHSARDVASLYDLLHRSGEPTVRDLIVLVHRDLEGAPATIASCFPSAERFQATDAEDRFPLGIRISAADRGHAGHCVAGHEKGLRVRYFNEEKGPIVDRVEAWPYRFGTTVDDRPFTDVVWSGRLHVAVAGAYYFRLHAYSSESVLVIGDDEPVRLTPGTTERVRLDGGDVPISARCRTVGTPQSRCMIMWGTGPERLTTVPPEVLRPDRGEEPPVTAASSYRSAALHATRR